MPKPAPITLPNGTVGQRVKLRDDSRDIEQVYDLAPLTRSRKRDIRRIGQELQKFDSDDAKAMSDDDETSAIRLMCDMISVFLDAPDDASDAGDLLFAGWENEQLTDDQIVGLLDRLQKVTEDPT